MWFENRRKGGENFNGYRTSVLQNIVFNTITWNKERNSKKRMDLKIERGFQKKIKAREIRNFHKHFYIKRTINILL